MSGFSRGDLERAVRKALAKRAGDSGPDADERFVLAVMANADAYRNAGCDEVLALATGHTATGGQR